MKKKKITSVLLTFVIAFSVLFTAVPTTVFADESTNDFEDAALKQQPSVNIQHIVEQTKDSLKAVTYSVDNKNLFDLIAKRYFSGAEKLNKKTEISKRDGIPISQVTDQRAIDELNQEIFNYGYYGVLFKKVQNEIENILPSLIENSMTGQTNAKDAEKEFIDKITNNKEKLLLGLTYIYRLYDFNMGDRNIKDILISNPDFYGKKFDSLDWFIRLGSVGGDMLSEGKNLEVFNNYFAGQVTDSRSLTDFLQENQNKLIPNKSLDEWFKETSKATIEEVQSKQNPTATYTAYSKLISDKKMQSHILPLLTVSENSIYLITNSATLTYGVVDTYVDRNLKQNNPELYQQKINEFKNKVTEIAKSQGDFIDLWYRIAKPEVRNQLQANRIVVDSLLLNKEGDTTSAEKWSAKLGPDASLGVTEFMTPMGMYAPSPGRIDAQAEGNGIRYFLVKALSYRGPSTYTHELTHLLEDSVWMNQEVRDGIQAEVYSRGLFETYEELSEPIFNLNLIYDQTGKDRFYNATPERFQTVQDLKEYMNGVLDVIYTLDYAEANVVLKRSDEDKLKWYHKFEQEVDTKTRYNHGNPNSEHNIDVIRKLNQDEVSKLKTVNDLIDNDIVVSRYEINGLATTGKAPSNGYYVVPLFTTNYAAVQNNKGVSGDITIRKYAYELLGEYGYYEGLVPFMSNQYKSAAEAENQILSDEYILGKIFKGEYKTMADFKKAMFKRRVDKKDALTPITISWKEKNVTIDKFETLESLMQEAVEKDLKEVVTNENGFNNMRSYQTSVERLKAQIFKAYLNQTNEFRDSIYSEVVQPTKTYTVHFEKGAADVVGEMQDQIFEYGTPQKLSKNTFTRKGYKFDGWEANGKTYVDEESVKNLVEEADGTIELSAIWKKLLEPTNEVPTILATDKTLTVGDTFDPLDGVTAKDKEDGQLILTEANILTNDVDMNQLGTYHVTYQVTDSQGATTEKTIIVVVNPKMEEANEVPTILATDQSLIVGDTFDPLDGVTAKDKEDGELILTEANILTNNVDMNQPGTYHVTYQVTDSQGATTVKTITVVVNQKMEELNEVPTILATDQSLIVGDTFDPLDGVTAKDKEDGELILTEANILTNNVDMNQPGTYHVTYQVTDSQGATTVKTIIVVVNLKMEEANEVPTIFATDKTLTIGDTFDPLDGVTAKDKEDGDITDNIELIKNDVNLSKAGDYEVTYKVIDSSGAIVTKTIVVTVKEKQQPVPVPTPDKETPTVTPDKENPSSIPDKKNPSSNAENKNQSQITSPQTGDTTHIGFWVTVMLLAGGSLVVLIRRKRNRK